MLFEDLNQKNRFINIFSRKLVTVTKRYARTINNTAISYIEYTKDIPTMITDKIDNKEKELAEFCKEEDDFDRTYISLSEFNRKNNTRLV